MKSLIVTAVGLILYVTILYIMLYSKVSEVLDNTEDISDALDKTAAPPDPTKKPGPGKRSLKNQYAETVTGATPTTSTIESETNVVDVTSSTASIITSVSSDIPPIHSSMLQLPHISKVLRIVEEKQTSK